MTAETSLIFGISGQDGAYLARLLLERGDVVHGVSRDHETRSFNSLLELGIGSQVILHSAVLSNFQSVLQVLSQVRPTRVYNLAAQSSVGLSFEWPIETLNSTINGTINILEAIRSLRLNTRVYNASSSECFGNINGAPADENTPFRPRSPYGVGKAAAFWAVINYRESYNIFACSGILFNHESPLRPSRYVTQKIVRGAADIAEGRAQRLSLGTLDIARDWGWAPEYVEAMVSMLELEQPEDFVIATGKLYTLEDFVARTFACFDLDWRRFVDIDPTLKRPSDIRTSVGNPGKAERLLGWRYRSAMPEVVKGLVEAEIARRRR